MQSHNEREHSRLGASGAHRWMVCPGSVALLEEFPTKTGDAAKDGTKTHELGEKILLDRFGVGDPISASDVDSSDRLDRANWYADFVVAEYDRLLTEYGDADYVVEDKFDLGYLHEDFFGTNDSAVWSDMAELHVFDLKDGNDPVTAEENPQLMYYALGVLYKHNLDVEKVFLHIVQPKRNVHDVWEVTLERLKVFEQQLVVAADNVKDNPTLKCPDTKACKWCNKLECDAFESSVKKEALVAFDSDPLCPDLTTKTKEELLKIAEWGPVIQKMVNDANTLLFRLATAGVEIPNRKLIRKTGNRAWKPDVDVEGELKKAGHDAEDIMVYTLKSPAQMEKVVDKKLVAELCHKPDKGLTLVDQSAKGEAVLANPFDEEEII